MGQVDIKEIEAGLKDWDFLAQLPPELHGFTLQPASGIKGLVLTMASYVNAAQRARLDLTYTTETFDYVPVKTVGLHVFRDERLFYRDRDVFAQQILAMLPRLIGEWGVYIAEIMAWIGAAILLIWGYYRRMRLLERQIQPTSK